MFEMGSGRRAEFEEGWCWGKAAVDIKELVPLVAGAGSASIRCCHVSSRVLGPSSVRPSYLHNRGNCGVLLLSPVSPSLPPPLHVSEWAFGDQPLDLAPWSVLRSVVELRKLAALLRGAKAMLLKAPFPVGPGGEKGQVSESSFRFACGTESGVWVPQSRSSRIRQDTGLPFGEK